MGWRQLGMQSAVALHIITPSQLSAARKLSICALLLFGLINDSNCS